MKNKYLLILVALLVSLSLVACSNDGEVGEENSTEPLEDTDQEKLEEEAEEKVMEEGEDDKKEEAEEDNSAYDDIKGEIVGKSNKDFKEISHSEPTEVRNDSTGNWRKTTISESINIEEYALSYYEEYVGEGEIHFIINFANNTTTRINKSGGRISVTMLEYVEKEEHDAKELGSGMLLGDYIIYPDGDIEEVTE